MRLKLVPAADPTPAEKVRQRLRRTAKPASVLECPKCAGRTMKIEVTGALLKNGKVTGGTKEHICSACDRKGERVVVA